MSQRRSMAPINPEGAISICFNDRRSMPDPFVGDLLVDTGIWVALFDETDGWSPAVRDFWDSYVLAGTHAPTFYITPDIINEYIHRITKNYSSRIGRTALPAKREEYARPLRILLQNRNIEHIDLDTKGSLRALDRWAGSSYGAKDAFHVTCQLDYGLDFMTVDHILMEELERDPAFRGRKVYFPALDMQIRRKTKHT